MRNPLLALLPALALSACAGGAAAPAATTPTPMTEPAPSAPISEPAESESSELVPAGYGTLVQDEITVQFRDGPLLIKVTPLAEEVIRLTAPDTYRRLHALATSRGGEAGGGMVREPERFLVSLFSYEANVEFQPENLELTAQGRRLRPAEITPVTPGWGRQRLQQQERQTAIYVFEGPIDYFRPITVQYGFERSDAWSGILRALEIERAKVRARQ